MQALLDALRSAYSLPKLLHQNFDGLFLEERRVVIFVVTWALIPIAGFSLKVLGFLHFNGLLGLLWMTLIVVVLIALQRFFPLSEDSSQLRSDLTISLESFATIFLCLGVALIFIFDSNQVAELLRGEGSEIDHHSLSRGEAIFSAISLLAYLSLIGALFLKHVFIEKLFKQDLETFGQVFFGLGYSLVAAESRNGKTKTLKKEIEIDSWKKLFPEPQILREGKKYMLYSVYLIVTKDKYGERHNLEEPQHSDPLLSRSWQDLQEINEATIRSLEKGIIEARQDIHPLDRVRMLHATEADVQERFSWFHQQQLYKLLKASEEEK